MPGSLIRVPVSLCRIPLPAAQITHGAQMTPLDNQPPEIALQTWCRLPRQTWEASAWIGQDVDAPGCGGGVGWGRSTVLEWSFWTGLCSCFETGSPKALGSLELTVSPRMASKV